MILTVAIGVICYVTWTHDNLRIDETPITNEEMKFLLYTPEHTYKIRGDGRYSYYRSIDRCLSCKEANIVACDKESDLCSEPAYLPCQPKPVNVVTEN